jgi:hypothetical protein
VAPSKPVDGDAVDSATPGADRVVRGVEHADRERWAAKGPRGPFDRSEVHSRVSNSSRAVWAHTGGPGMQGFAHGRENTPYRVRPDKNCSGGPGGRKNTESAWSKRATVAISRATSVRWWSATMETDPEL